ncbi:MAG: hypothetical protein ABL904_13855 [Hyphomicrobiaceae bacterium]
MKKMIIAVTFATTLAGMATAALAHRAGSSERPAPAKPDLATTLFDQIGRNGK